jgi:hypothetical protein
MVVAFMGAARRAVLAALFALLAAASASAQVSVTTHHYDVARTGWNPNETALTYKAMANKKAGQAFGLLRSVALDAQVDGQPLVVPGAIIDGDPNPGTHDVVFVVTEQNTVYAIDPTRGTVLNSRNFGAAIPFPLGCNNNAATVGINGTPVIDTSTNSLYLITYTNPSQPTYTLHRLALHDFSDVVTPEVITASHKLNNGGTFTFNATYQRQRAAMLLQNGAIYAAFTSFCDFSGANSRGWLLGWNPATLAPLTVNSAPLELMTDIQAHDTDDTFLATIWMSGSGVAADPLGNLYFVTGNSDPGSYTGITSIQESAVKFSPAKNKVTSLFTPYDVTSLDGGDVDFGSGGITVLPNSVTGLPPRLAAAVGKDGWMFLMNRDSLGGYNGPNGPDNVIARVQVGGCWCQPSYFELNGVPQIVSSGGSTLQLWALSGTGTPLVEGLGATVNNPSRAGFFTTVSSNGSQDPIIWAVTRPGRSGTNNITLLAYAAGAKAGGTALAQLYDAVVGTWPSRQAFANIVPVVANGLVYVAGYQQLAIYGLGAATP